MAMIRKQFFIDAKINRELKQRAAAQGVSEADLIRPGVDKVLSETVDGANWRNGLSKLTGAWAERDDMQELVQDSRRGWGRRTNRLGLAPEKS